MIVAVAMTLAMTINSEYPVQNEKNHYVINILSWAHAYALFLYTHNINTNVWFDLRFYKTQNKQKKANEAKKGLIFRLGYCEPCQAITRQNV